MHPRFVLVGSALAGFSLLTALDAAVKAGLLLGIAALVVLVGMRRTAASSRHLVWLCALTGALLLPFGFKLLPQWRVLPSWLRWEEAPRLFQVKAPAPVIVQHPMAAASLPSETHSPRSKSAVAARPTPSRASAAPVRPAPLRLHAWWFMAAWLTGGVLCLLPVGVSALALRRTASQSRRLTDGPLFDAVAQVSREISLRRMPMLLLGRPSSMPMVWGVFRTSLLLPSQASEWSPQRLRAVLLHELSHLRRRDPLTLWIAHLALAAHWFNPLAWLTVRQLRREQEQACDDCVLRHGLQASAYASEMLEIATTQQVGVARLAALTMARQSGLESRVAGILDAARNRSTTTRRWAVGVASVATLLALPLAMLKAAPEAALRRGKLLDRNGLVLAESPEAGTRVYPFKSLAAHLIGFVKREPGNGFAGNAGVEKLYDETLRAGKDVTLALDARMQSRVENALRSAGIGRGAVVVIDCTNGDLLATASFPAFDPNHFVPSLSVERFKEYSYDPTAPLLNRALMPFSPGSTFKLLTAMAACRAGHADAHHDCEGFIKFGNLQVGCWIWNAQRGKHGDLNLHDALTQSCNCYFMQAGQQVGIDAWVETGSLLGLGAVTGSGLPSEAAGVLPSPATQQARGIDRPWSPTSTAIHAIGAGESQATPLQMAALLAGIGNGERLLVPRVNLADPPQIRVEFLKHGWRAEELGVMRNALRDNVVEPGNVGSSVRSERVEIAGAPGTAQAMDAGKKSNNAWFVGYAPATAPRYAIAVVVQNATSGAKIAGPIARQVLEDLQSELPPPIPQDPTTGHLNRIEPAAVN